MGYHLGAGVSFCCADARRVFLDINRDRYFCLGPDADASLARLLSKATLDAQDIRHLDGLTMRGVLRIDQEPDSVQACLPPAAVQKSLFATAGKAGMPATITALIGFRKARWQLRHRGLARSLNQIAERKRRIQSIEEPALATEAIARAFKGAAALATTWDFCLAHSLAVASALVGRNVPAELILGVHMGPFMAHAWVQYRDAVVNDTVDTVRDFTPILVV